MSLLDSEIWRIKYELGYNILQNSAEPYIGVVAIFNQVIQANVSAGVATTSTTAVAASSTPTRVTITLASASGFTAGCRVAIDVDDQQESATVESVSGSTIILYLSKAHGGTYPVTVEAGESIVREILRKLYKFSKSGGSFDQGLETAGLKKVDEIEFFGRDGTSKLDSIKEYQTYWRNELASALGVINLRDVRSGNFYEAY